VPRTADPIDPEAKAYAVAEEAKGRSTREIAAELREMGYKASHMTVSRWCAAAKRANPPGALEALRARQTEAEAAPAPTPPADPDAPFDFEAAARQMLREAFGEAEQHRKASNPRGVQAAMNTAAKALSTLAQVEKRKPQDPDVISFSMAAIEKEWAALSELLAALCARPVLCSDCTRKLSTRYGRGEA
jgi:hypothetical protein